MYLASDPKFQFQNFILQIKLLCVQNDDCRKPIFVAMFVLAKIGEQFKYPTKGDRFK